MSSGIVCLALLLVAATQHTVQSQTIIINEIGLSASFSTSEDIPVDRRGIAQLEITINGNVIPSVDLNRPGGRTFVIPAGAQILYNGLGLLAITGSETLTGITTYQYITQEPFLFEEFTTVSNLPGQVGPGTLYSDGEGRAFFTDSDFVIEFIRSQNFPVPPPQATISVDTVQIDGDAELVLNVRTDNVEQGVIQLTGAECFNVGAGDTVEYRGRTVQVRRGASTQVRRFNIGTFNVLQDIVINGQRGRSFNRFTNDAPGIFNGPGTLKIGNFQGSLVALFSTLDTAGEISGLVVDAQLIFDPQPGIPAVQISDIITTPGVPNELITIDSGTRTFSFPTAVRIEYNNGNIQVFDGFGQLLGSFFGFDLVVFVNNEIVSFRAGDSGTINFPPGGVTLILSQNEGQACAYPSRNTALQERIDFALSQVSFTPRPFPAFRINGDSSGSATLSADPTGGNNIGAIVRVTDNPPIVVGGTQFVAFDGATEVLRVFDRSDPSQSISGTPITGISSLTVFESPGNFYDVLRFNRSRYVAGPCGVYFDNDGRAFLTNADSINSLISGFIFSLPPANINTRVTTVNGGGSVVEIVNGNERIITVESTTTIDEVDSNQGVIYTDNTVRTVNGFPVPPGATVEVVANTDGTFTIIVRLNGVELYRSTASSVFNQQTSTNIAGNTTLLGGGIIYYNPDNGPAVISSDRSASTSLVNSLITNGITFPSITPNITELNFFDGLRVTQFSGGSSSFLPGPGAIFTTGSSSFFSTDTNRNGQILGEVSTLRPVTITVSSTTGETLVISGTTGQTIFGFNVRNFRTRSISSTGSLTYMNGVIVLPGTNITTNRVVYYNGIEVRTLGPGDTETIEGPIEIFVDEETGDVFVTTDRTTARRIIERINRTNFNRPQLARPTETTVRSKFSDVSALFGQAVTVYDSATVTLRCRYPQGNPIPLVVFSRNDTELTGDEDRINITMVSPFETQLVIQEVTEEDAVRYGCRVSNVAGRDRAFTDLTVLPAVPVSINNNYFPLVDNGGLTITATDSNILSVSQITIPDRTAGGIPATETSLISTINLACKADGLPRGIITWSAVGSNGIAVPINQSNVMIPRPGRSIYTVDTSSGNTDFVTYTCTASNIIDVQGSVRVEPSSYACEGTAPSGECSATCGFGLQEQVPIDCSVSRDENPMTIAASELPPGLFSTTFEFCLAPVLCPEVTFEFDDPMFGECSVTCGGGQQSRSLTCFRVLDGTRNESVDIQECLDFNVPVPITVRDCNDDRCPRWVITSDYTECSSTCAGGTRTRTVVCMQMIDLLNNVTMEPVLDENGLRNRTDTVVPDTDCLAGQMPRAMDDCNTQIPCPTRWSPEPWGPCVDSCQERSLTCTRFDTSDPGERWVIPDEQCIDPRPHTVRSCDGGRCVRGTWVSLPSPCSVSCGVGQRSTSAACIGSDGNVVPDYLCDPTLRPNRQERCTLFNCPGRCDIEPTFCLIARNFGCKTFENVSNGALLRPCCRSCPLQARAPDFPPVIAQSELVLDLVPDLDLDPSRDSYDVREGADLKVCCVASSTTTPNAFLNFLVPCSFSYEDNMGNEFSSMVFVGNELNNRACTYLDTSGLPEGEVFELTLDGFGGQMPSVVNITVIPNV